MKTRVCFVAENSRYRCFLVSVRQTFIIVPSQKHTWQRTCVIHKYRFSCETILACVNVVKVELVPNLAGFRDCQVLLIGYLFAEAKGGSEQ